jgi:hypothetical protein
MSTSAHDVHVPRPWYISLTPVWQDDPRNYLRLDSLLEKSVFASQLAGNHIAMPHHSRHFTVLAVMKINGLPARTQSMREFAGRVFEPIRSNGRLVRDLRTKFRTFKSFTAKVYEVRCYDNGLALQFECDQTLEDFRNFARTALDIPVSVSVKRHANSEAGRRFRKGWEFELVESILDDPAKNYGHKAFGSIARSPCRSDNGTERWRKRFTGVTLKFERIHLLVSDETLTNPRTPKKEDILIP